MGDEGVEVEIRGRPSDHSLQCCVFVCVSAQPVLYWCSRNMSFWSNVSFNLAVLINVLVAFFYPLDSISDSEYT